jgi:hypothetical protein
MPDADPVIQFPQDPNDLHVGVLQEKTSLSVQGWVFGRWLQHMKATGAWQQVTLGAARFPDWNTYLGKGVGMSDVQARKYLACAWFPSYVLKQLGIERCARSASSPRSTRPPSRPSRCNCRCPMAASRPSPTRRLTRRRPPTS